MTFAVLAEFPLGTYRGHRGGGALDEVASPARLHAALLNAAASGTRAVPEADHLAPSEQDSEALEWLEQHPPDGMVVPESWINDEHVNNYRDEGLLFRSKSHVAVKRPNKLLTGSVAWAGPIGWTWQEPPAEPVRGALAELCRDVAYLGMAESPARLAVGEAEPTHLLDKDATGFGGGAISAAAPGRSDELQKAHSAATQRAPTAAADRDGSDEKVVRPPVPASAYLRAVRYRSRTPAVSWDTEWPPPWETVLCVPLTGEVPPDLRVRAAESVHRGLIKKFDDLRLDVPPCVTGNYPSGHRRPANGAAIQFVPATHHPDNTSLLAVFVPTGMPEATNIIERALDRLPVISVPKKLKVRVDGPPIRVAATEFWTPPPDGMMRSWITEPAAVPDLRPLRTGWSGADTVAASAALLWRDDIAAPGRGDARARGLAAGARERGVQVHDVRMVTGHASRFVHKVPDGRVVRPYRTTLHLGELAGECTALALGQSRHLGCGLLVPRDHHPDEIPESYTRS